jgi:hypothetical protein
MPKGGLFRIWSKIDPEHPALCSYRTVESMETTMFKNSIAQTPKSAGIF